MSTSSYDAVVTTLATNLNYQLSAGSPVTTTDTAFNAQIPAILQDAEQRIYRELDFLATRKVVSSVTFTANSRNLNLPTEVLVLEQANAITPISAGTPDAGTRVPLQRLPLAFLNAIWPSAAQAATATVPAYYAMVTDVSIQAAPTPDAAYICELVYTFRPAGLSSSAPSGTTYISVTYPDLLIAAAMVYGAGYKGNFGAQSDDPRQALAWEALYQSRKASAVMEEMRRKGIDPGNISPTAPPPDANMTTA